MVGCDVGTRGMEQQWTDNRPPVCRQSIMTRSRQPNSQINLFQNEGTPSTGNETLHIAYESSTYIPSEAPGPQEFYSSLNVEGDSGPNWTTEGAIQPHLYDLTESIGATSRESSTKVESNRLGVWSRIDSDGGTTGWPIQKSHKGDEVWISDPAVPLQKFCQIEDETQTTDSTNASIPSRASMKRPRLVK